MAKDFIIDAETLGLPPDGVLVDFSVLAFDSDPNKVETFEELCSNALRVKFSLKSQKGQRVIDAKVVEWWKKQDVEAQVHLKPTDADVTINEGVDAILAFLDAQGVTRKESHGYCRGQSFDFPFLVNILQQRFGDRDTFYQEPCFFWNQRDIRTAIEFATMTRGVCTVPLPKGILNGFVKHNSVHDCAKDVLMLKYAQRYALGLDEVPTDPDPLSIK